MITRPASFVSTYVQRIQGVPPERCYTARKLSVNMTSDCKKGMARSSKPSLTLIITRKVYLLLLVRDIWYRIPKLRLAISMTISGLNPNVACFPKRLPCRICNGQFSCYRIENYRKVAVSRC